MNDNEKLPPPGQDSSLWGQHLFVNIEVPADWCTVRQAQEHQNRGNSDSVVNHVETSDGDDSTNLPDEHQPA